MAETITFHGSTYTILFPDLMRQLTPEEFADLGEAIRRKGRVIKPIVTDGRAGIIDGIHRMRWAVELRLPKKAVPFDPAGMGLDFEGQRQLCIDLNDTGRQDTFEIRKANRGARIARVAAARREGQSLRTIAEAENVSKTQVVEDLKAATVQGVYSSPPNGTVFGEDNRPHPATVPPKPVPQRRPRQAGAAKNGAVKWTWKEFESSYGALIRQVDALARAYKVPTQASEAKALREQLREYKAAMVAWHKSLSEAHR